MTIEEELQAVTAIEVDVEASRVGQNQDTGEPQRRGCRKSQSLQNMASWKKMQPIRMLCIWGSLAREGSRDP